MLYNTPFPTPQGTFNLGLANNTGNPTGAYGSAMLLRLLQAGTGAALIQNAYGFASPLYVNALAGFIMGTAPVYFENIFAQPMGATNYGDASKNHFLSSRTVDKWLYNGVRDTLASAVLGVRLSLASRRVSSRLLLGLS